MPKYKICFACTLPDEPDCSYRYLDNDFFSEHSFEGNPADTIKEAERISSERYKNDFNWWIVEENKNEKSFSERERWQNRFNKADKFTYHESLQGILEKPTYIFQTLPSGAGTFQQLGRQFDIKLVRYVIISCNAYNNGEIVNRGREKLGTTGGNDITKSVITVEEMVYDHCLARDKDLTHLVRQEEHLDRNRRRQSLFVDVYEFKADEDKLAGCKEKAVERERVARSSSLCKKLEEKGTTL